MKRVILIPTIREKDFKNMFDGSVERSLSYIPQNRVGALYDDVSGFAKHSKSVLINYVF